jgi:hypothetical protein
MAEYDWLVRLVTETCARVGSQYLTVGSIATSTYGDPRFTNDIDIVVDLQPTQIEEFCQAFPDPFYLSRPAVDAAVRQRTQFNIVHTTSGLKIDCILTDGSPHCQSEMSRGVKRIMPGGLEVMLASPEDVIIKKMEYYRLGGSDKHIRDITGVLKQCPLPIDRGYIEHWSEILGLMDIWQSIIARTDAH